MTSQSEDACTIYRVLVTLSTNPRKGAEEGMQVKVAASKGQNSGEDRRRRERKKEGPFEDQVTKANSKEQSLKTQETKKNSLLAENHRTHYPSPTTTQTKTHSKFKKSYSVSLH